MTLEEIEIVSSVVKSLRHKPLVPGAMKDTEDAYYVIQSLEILGYAIIPRGLLMALKHSIEEATQERPRALAAKI